MARSTSAGLAGGGSLPFIRYVRQFPQALPVRHIINQSSLSYFQFDLRSIALICDMIKLFSLRFVQKRVAS